MPPWLNALSIAVVFVGFLGAAVAYLRGSRDKGTIDILNRHSDAQDIEIADLNATAARLQRDNANLTARVAVLERENVALAAERPSRERLTELHDILTSFVADSQQSNVEIRALLMAIAELIEPRDT